MHVDDDGVDVQSAEGAEAATDTLEQLQNRNSSRSSTARW
jgi:hypothetical protein